MDYLRVRWVNAPVKKPEIWDYEINQGWATRQILHYHDGRLESADEDEHSGQIRLAEKEIPPPEEISRDPEFVVEEISQGEFQILWTQAVRSGRLDG